MVPMRGFANYVFDFYGTLADVHTDENKPALWLFMADFFAVHGCTAGAEELRGAFWRIDAEERAAARRRSGLEHAEMMRTADWIVDLGPGAGREGGNLMYQGDFKGLLKCGSLTADYLTGRKKIQEAGNGKGKASSYITLSGC